MEKMILQDNRRAIYLKIRVAWAMKCILDACFIHGKSMEGKTKAFNYFTRLANF